MVEALKGIRVIEWATFFAGPITASMLGDLGAEVIKIEAPVRGDAIRGIEEISRRDVKLEGGSNAMSEAANRNKKSICLDLTKDEGREIAYRLIKKSDVFLTNYLTGAISKCGMDYETISKINPRIIYASLSGWGKKGQWAGAPAFDLAAQAYSGMMMCMGEPNGPTLLHTGPVDLAAATVSAFQIMTALFTREREGFGQEVHTSLLSSAMWLMHLDVMSAFLLGIDYPRHERRKAPNPLRNFYKCSDGKWIVVVHFQSQPHWKSFCKTLGIQSLENDSRFRDASVREQNAEELVLLLDNLFASKTREEWLEILKQNGLVCAPINLMTELSSDPQVIANEYVIKAQHPDLGEVLYPGFPYYFSKTPPRLESTMPRLGEHTEEVLIELGDYGWNDIAVFKDKGLI